MKLCMGRIGAQEAASIVGIALTVSTVFTLDSEEAYRGGNATYVVLPIAVLLALGLFLLNAWAMRKTGKESLLALADYAFGKFFGSVCSALLVALFAVNAYLLLSRFADMVHAFIFVRITSSAILFWIMATVAFLAFYGFECIGRTAKCLGVLLGVLLLLELVIPASSYEAYRLFPLPLDEPLKAGKDALASVFLTAPALLALLCLSKGVNGVKSARKAGAVGAGVSAVLVGLTQLAIGLAFTYAELGQIFVPLYRINVKVAQESYFFRMDKVALFFWLIAALIAGAYYVYSAAFVFTKRWSRYDVRPAVISLCAAILCVLCAEHTDLYEPIHAALRAAQRYGAWVAAVPFALLPAVALCKASYKKGKTNDEKA